MRVKEYEERNVFCFKMRVITMDGDYFYITRSIKSDFFDRDRHYDKKDGIDIGYCKETIKEDINLFEEKEVNTAIIKDIMREDFVEVVCGSTEKYIYLNKSCIKKIEPYWT